MYSEKVMDHFAHPRNVGEIENPSGTGTVGNAKCGDIMKMDIKVENGIITDVKFKTFGCGAAIATSSMVTELAKGKTIAEALKIKNSDVAAALGGLPDIKLHCSLLAQEGIEAAVADYYLKKDGKLPEGYKVPANTISPKVGEGNIADEEEHYVSEDNRNTDEKK